MLRALPTSTLDAGSGLLAASLQLLQLKKPTDLPKFRVDVPHPTLPDDIASRITMAEVLVNNSFGNSFGGGRPSNSEDESRYVVLVLHLSKFLFTFRIEFFHSKLFLGGLSWETDESKLI